MDPLEHYLTYGLLEGRKPNPGAKSEALGAIIDAENECLKQLSFEGEVALYVTHTPRGRLKPDVVHYLNSLKRQGIAVVLIVAAEEPFTAIDPGLLDRLDGVLVRQNLGYEFAAWAHILRLYPQLFDAKILYLVNDSVYGPTNDAAFGRLLTELRESRAEYETQLAPTLRAAGLNCKPLFSVSNIGNPTLHH
jgi:hypothetical protein